MKWLKHFFREKLILYGQYQDSIDFANPYLYHSVISPMLNVGILTDTIVITELIKFLYKHESRIPI
jgi:deoxyribodipyrimidine photolyase-related protein